MNIEWPIEIIELILEHSDGDELSHHDKNSRSFLVDQYGRSRVGFEPIKGVISIVDGLQSSRKLNGH